VLLLLFNTFNTEILNFVQALYFSIPYDFYNKYRLFYLQKINTSILVIQAQHVLRKVVNWKLNITQNSASKAYWSKDRNIYM
jgi:hypothetical protein